MYTISIDPGQETGMAVFKGTDLAYVRRIYSPYGNEEIANEIIQWLPSPGEKRFVVERPREYPSRPGVRKADLVTLSLCAGFIAGRLSQYGPIAWVEAPDWKGSIPKPKSARYPYIVATRCQRILTPTELLVVKGNVPWDIWDAVGMGLVYLKRATVGLTQALHG